MRCPLCRSDLRDPSFGAHGKDYFRCSGCSLFFLHEDHWIPLGAERARYELHRNHEDDEGYLKYLDPIRSIVRNGFSKGSRGLDYGCGKNPVLTHLLQKDGFDIDPYDPLFQYSCPIDSEGYDFIFSCEAFEHFHNVKKELECMKSGLKPGGQLIVQTQTFEDPERLRGSHYIRDETHVCFFSQKTFEWIGKEYDLEVEFPMKNIAILRK